MNDDKSAGMVALWATAQSLIVALTNRLCVSVIALLEMRIYSLFGKLAFLASLFQAKLSVQSFVVLVTKNPRSCRPSAKSSSSRFTKINLASFLTRISLPYLSDSSTKVLTISEVVMSVIALALLT